MALKAPPGPGQLLGLRSAHPHVPALQAWDVSIPCSPPPPNPDASQPRGTTHGFWSPVPSGAEHAEPPIALTSPRPLGVTPGGRSAVSAVPASALSGPMALSPALPCRVVYQDGFYGAEIYVSAATLGLVPPPGTLSWGVWG